MNTTQPASAGAIVREGFANKEIERRGETTSSALVAQARAEIEARYVMALQRPRDFGDVRVKLLKACERPEFAARAMYSIPRRGAKGRLTGAEDVVEGLSVRFAEEAVRQARNIWQPTRTTYDDDYKRQISVSCIDLENNITYGKEVLIDKTVERREAKDGRVVLGQRTNSAGTVVYIVQSTEEELLQKENALCSRALRTEALRLIPADIIEECEKKLVQTRTNETKRDPDGARKQIADSFAALGVMPSELALYLGIADLAAAAPVQLDTLRGLYVAVREGDVVFAEALKAVTTLRDVPAKDDGKPSPEQTQAQKITDKVKAKTEKMKAAAQAKAEQAKGAAKADKPSAAETKTDPEPPCMTCGKPIAGAKVETSNADGVVGFRHPKCAPAHAQREGEPGEEG